MKVTTCIERNPRGATTSSGNLLSCISAVEKAIWEALLSFKEHKRIYIEHVSVKIIMGNDGMVPHSVTIKIKIKGNNPWYSFERETALTFDANKDYNENYGNLGKDITAGVKEGVDEIFQGVIENLKIITKGMKKDFSV